MPTSSNPSNPTSIAPAHPSPGNPSAESPSASDPKLRGEGPDRRYSRVDRRTGLERRVMSTEASDYNGPERRVAERREDTGLERRRGPGRRLSDSRKSAEEGEMNSEQYEFIMAIEAYKKANRRMYPTWTEILEVFNQLGYRKVAHREVRLDNVPEPELQKVA